MNIQIASLHIYPIKGCRGITLSSANVEPRGLRYDRRWMLVQADTGGFLSQRSHPEMARIEVQVGETGQLAIAFEDEQINVPTVPDAELIPRTVSVWSFTGNALDCGDDAAQFFSRVFSMPVRLVRVPEGFTRRLNPTYAKTSDDSTGFADGYPILLASASSLVDLNERLAAPIPMNRFRPNLVLSGDLSPWQEHTWEWVRIGDTLLHAVKPCDRCAVTTIDQDTGTKTGAEPLATLAKFRKNPASGKVDFGINLVPDRKNAGGTVSIGDPVTVG